MSLENRGRKNPIGSDVTWWDGQASHMNDRHSLQNVLSGVGSFVWGYSGKFTLPRVHDGMNVLHGGETRARASHDTPPTPVGKSGWPAALKEGKKKSYARTKVGIIIGPLYLCCRRICPFFNFSNPLTEEKKPQRGGILHFSPLVDVYWIAFL